MDRARRLRQPFELALFLRHVEGLTFDVMLEAKDLALLRLRRDLPRYAPDQAPRFGLDPAESAAGEPGEGEDEAEE